jgi:molecular chaperone DnaK
LIHSVSKNLTEHGSKLDEETRASIQKAIDDAKTVDQNASLESIKEKSAALSTAAMKIGEAMYKKDGSSTEAKDGASQDEQPKTDGAQDAEFKEKK